MREVKRVIESGNCPTKLFSCRLNCVKLIILDIPVGIGPVSEFLSVLNSLTEPVMLSEILKSGPLNELSAKTIRLVFLNSKIPEGIEPVSLFTSK
jgi:hypothetical protein